MDCLSVFNPSRLLISSLYICLFSLSLSPSISLLFLSLLFPLNSHTFFFFLLQIWLYERLQLLHPLTISPSQYQPKHPHDRKLKNKEMDPAEFTKFLKHLSPLSVQWVVEWWCIMNMVNHGLKDNCVPLVLASPLLLLLYMLHCETIW